MSGHSHHSHDFLICNANHEPVSKFAVIGEELGSGAFSVVYDAQWIASGEARAIKVVDKSRLEGKEYMLIGEVDILKSADHPNIIRLYDVFEDEKNISLVMEKVTGGELFDQIVQRGHYSERDAAVVMAQILDALHYLHKHSVVHRDLKPENVLYATSDITSTIKIADFGLSKLVGAQTVLKTACGTPGYVAPEVLAKKEAQTGYTAAVDLWSAGVILYILLCGFPPFYADSTRQLFNDIRAAKYDFPSPYWDSISVSAKDLVRRLMCLDAHARLTAAEALEHPWITSSAPTDLIEGIADRMREYNNSRRFKKVALAIVAVSALRSMSSVLDALKPGEQEELAATLAASSGSPSSSSSSSAAAAAAGATTISTATSAATAEGAQGAVPSKPFGKSPLKSVGPSSLSGAQRTRSKEGIRKSTSTVEGEYSYYYSDDYYYSDEERGNTPQQPARGGAVSQAPPKYA